MLESTINHMKSTKDSLMISILDTTFDQEKQRSHIRVDDLFFDYSDKNNQVERFMETFRNSKAESNEVLYKNLMEILKQCTDFPQKNGNVSKSMCANYIVNKVNTMLNEIDTDTFPPELDTGYYSPLKSSSVSAWIAGKRSIDRLSIFKIAFGLQLPFENKSVFSYQSLFNRVFNQRYCLKRADEMTFSYCLKNEKPYAEALQIIISYKRAEKEFLINRKTQEKNVPVESTKHLFYTVLSAKGTDELIEILINKNTTFISEKNTVNDELNSRAAVFNNEDVMKSFNQRYDTIKSALTIKEMYFSIIEESRDDYDRKQFEKDIETKYPNFYNYVVVSDGIFDNAQKQLALVNYLLRHPEKLELFINEDDALEEQKNSLRTDEYYNAVGCPEFLRCINTKEDITAQLENIKADLSLILEIVEPMHFQKLKLEKKDKVNKGEQTNHADIKLNIMSESIKPDSVPREVFVDFSAKTSSKNSNYYESIRKLIVIISFFNYFNDYIGESYSKEEFREIADGFITEINHILSYYNYNELYAYNTFDLFFFLCIHTTDPIYTYYLIIRYYTDKYYILNRPDRDLEAFIKKYKIK